MTTKTVHVAVAVIRDADGRVLCTQRLPHQHLAGLWEFPGGKLEPGESLAEGLRREIREELGLEVASIAPLLRVVHHYPGKSVLLDVWRVLHWHGEPHGREGQPLRWQHPADMQPAEFPPADVPIIDALRLPARYVISPDIVDDAGIRDFVARARATGVRLVQVRLKSVPSLAPALVAALRAALPPGARVLVNSDCLGAGDALPPGADGVHLTAAALRRATAKPSAWCAASCHDTEELAKAWSLGVDFATLSPVARTESHPAAEPLGWPRFRVLAADAGLPVYALGGLAAAALPEALAAGAVGIAGIGRILD